MILFAMAYTAHITKKAQPLAFAVAALLLLMLILWSVPATQQRVVTWGLDRYQYHQPLFGNRTVAQEVVIEKELRGIGAVLVDLRRAENIPDVIVRIREADNPQLHLETTIPAHHIQDDQFAVTTFDQPLLFSHKKVLVEFSAPAASSKNPVGIRFHPKNVYEEGALLVNGAATEGDAALLLVERVPLYRYIGTMYAAHRDSVVPLLWSSIAALVAVLLTTAVWRRKPAAYRRNVELALIILLGLLTVGLHLYLLPAFHGFSGGDPYNYLFIAKKISLLENPFTDTKRLPGYPLLLLPAFLTAIDDRWWMLFVSSLAAGGSIAAIGLLARTLRLPWPVQLLSVVALIGHKDFFWTSFRPEPYTLYALCLLAVLLLFFRLHASWKIRVLFGLLLGYAAMVRQEGFALACVLGIFSLLFSRQVWLGIPSAWPLTELIPRSKEISVMLRRWTVAFLPALLLVLPFLSHNIIKYGNPFYTPYFEGERLQIVDSWYAFLDSLGATWGVVGSAWWPLWDQDFRILHTDPILVTAIVFTFAWFFLARSEALHPAAGGVTSWYWGRLFTSSRTLLGSVLILWGTAAVLLVWGVVAHKAAAVEIIMKISAGILLASPILFVVRTGWRGAIVVTVALTQMLIALWFHPFAKHFQQAYPLLVLLMASAVIFPLRLHSAASRIRALLASTHQFVILTAVLVIAAFLLEKLPAHIDKHNAATALDTVVYQAIQAAGAQPGPYAFDQGYLPAHLYFGEEGAYFNSQDPHTPQEERAWLERQEARTLLVTSDSTAFRELGAAWRQIFYTKSEGRNEQLFESWVHIRP